MSIYSISSTLNPDNIFMLKKSDLENRFDPKFYKKEYKDNLAKIKLHDHVRLGDIVKFSSETWNQKDYFNDFFSYIEISEIDTLSGEIRNVSIVKIVDAPSRAKMIVRENDIIVSTTRPNRGAIALINREQNLSIASTGFAVIRNIITNAAERKYLYTILRQPMLLMQFDQRCSGGNYPAITQEELSNVIIPLPSNDKQNAIIKAFEECFREKKENDKNAEELLTSIDTFLLTELGINLPVSPVNTLKSRTFTINIQEMSSSRFDSNYYRLLHKDNYNALINSKYKVQYLKDISDRIFQGVGRNIDENSEYLLLKVKNIRQNCEIEYDEIEKIANPPTSKFLKKGDIITPCIGEAIRQIKFAVFEREDKKYFVDNNTGVIRPNEDSDSNFIKYCLCSSIGRLQINRLIGGGGVPFLGADNLKKILIPTPPLNKQREIAEHITEIRQKAERLKDKTKIALVNAGKEIEDILLN